MIRRPNQVKNEIEHLCKVRRLFTYSFCVQKNNTINSIMLLMENNKEVSNLKGLCKQIEPHDYKVQ